MRQFEALIRLSEASAKIRLDNLVRIQDAERAISIMKYSLQQLGYEEGVGYDIDKFETGISSTQRGMMTRMLDIISELESEQSRNPKATIVAAPEEEVKVRARDAYGFEDVKIEETLEKLKQQGMIYSPGPGFVKKVS